MTKSPDNIPRCLNLMVIAKRLERIADHATNIAEEVVYLCEAQDIRHTGALASTTGGAAQSSGPGPI
jgi:phosphate transport system protein